MKMKNIRNQEIIEGIGIRHSSLLINPDNSVWELVFDSLPDMVALVDLNNKVAKANKAMLLKLNIGDDSIIGSRCNILMHGDSKCIDDCPHKKMIVDNQQHSVEYYEPKFDCYLNVTTTPVFDANNNLLGSLHIARDISKQKEYELKLTEFNTELRELNQSKDKFFSIVAHDLRSPFQGLLGYTDLMLDELDSLEKSEMRDYLGKIRNSASNTLTLLENLLNWSRLQSGRLTYNPSFINISKLLRDIIDLLASAIQNKEIKLDVEVNPNCIVYSDQHMIKSILLNLFSNAIKFSYPGGVVSIHCKYGFIDTHSITNDGTEIDQNVEISIIDSGEGISEEEKEKLFDANNHYTRPGTMNESGAGLGLVLVKEMLEIQGSKLRINSNPGKGSRFSFTLPVKV